MKEIKYFVHGNSPYIIPHYMMLSEFPAELREGEKLAHEAMRKAGTACLSGRRGVLQENRRRSQGTQRLPDLRSPCQIRREWK